MASIVTTSSHRPTGGPRSRAVVIAAAAIVILAVVGYLLLQNGKAPSEPPPTGKSSATAAPSAAPVETRDDPSRGFKEQASTIVTNANGSTTEIHAGVYGEPETSADGADKANPDKKPSPVRKPLKRKFFDNPVENQLEVLSNRAVRFKNLPRTRLSDEEIMEYLRKPISIEADDDAETVAAKERTAEMKTLALKYIEEGGTYEQFIQEQAKASTEEAETRRAVHAEAVRILKSEGLQAAEEYLAEVNPQLKEAGLQEVGIPLALRRKAEVEAEERAAAEKAR